MAETFVNVPYAATTTPTAMYTCPAATTGIVVSIQCANITGADATITATMDNEGSTAYHLVKDLTVPANAAVNIIAGKVFLDADDEIVITASANTTLELVGAVLEIT